MSEIHIPLSEPTIGGNARAYLAECLDSNFVSSVGPFVTRFEEKFAASVGARYAVACSSGTAAIHVALRVAGVGAGDEVFVPTLTFIASANPVSYLSGRVTLIDVEQASMNIDPQIVTEELERRARRGAKQPRAIQLVHLLGHPASADAIVQTAQQYGVIVIEDAAEALGASYRSGDFRDCQVGTIGRVGCFSFNGNKLITTGGGGAITTDDADVAAYARHLTTQARLPGRAYVHDEVGYNYRLTNVAAALGLAQLEQLPSLLDSRRRIAARYDAAIQQIEGLLPARRAAWANPSFWLYTTSIVPDLTPALRDLLLDYLAVHGVEARPIWTPLHLMDPYNDATRLGGAAAEALFERAISLPSSSSLTAAQQDRVIELLGTFFTAHV
jgi:dTDP-4-amino-4,6-dideoxygalactose transaminase